MSPVNSEFEKLRGWLIKNGGYAHPSLTREIRDGLAGIYARQPLAADTVLVDIPRHLILGPHLLGENERPFGMTAERDLTLYVFLTEWRKGSASLFYPWMTQLPSLNEFKSYHPLFASPEDLIELGSINPRITETIGNFRRRILEFQNKTCGQFEDDEVTWASLVYLTRAFEGNGLLPFCDMFNHDAQRGRGLVADRYLKTRKKSATGDQIFISYGANFDSLDLWLHFGFSDPAAGTVIQCSNIKSPHYTFDQSCFIDDKGPSPQLTQACGRTEVLHALLNVLIAEIKSPMKVNGALGVQAAELLESRRRVLVNAQMHPNILRN